MLNDRGTHALRSKARGEVLKPLSAMRSLELDVPKAEASSRARTLTLQQLLADHFSCIVCLLRATMTSPGPRRIAQIIHLKRESLQAYKDCHAAAWPAVLEEIKSCNISDYSIYLDDQSMTLFATMKYNGSNFEADMEKMRANPEVRRWWQMTDSMQETLVEGSQGSTDPKGWWKDLEEVFRCE